MSVALVGVMSLCWLVSVVCWIIVVIRMFGHGMLTGILGIICNLYALVWGFLNKDEQGLGAVMIAWTASLLISAGVVVAFMSMAASGQAPVPTP